MAKKAIVAMSGGVDSSVAAFLCKSAGYECIGATLKLFDGERESRCCSLDDVEDARAVARALSMPYYVFNFKRDFEEQVVSRFVSGYLSGATPNPCVDCNRYVKFGGLFRRMRELDFDLIATGHYARVEKSGSRYLLKKGVDPKKDQSYFLYSLTSEELRHVYFPLGELRKSEVREIAEREGLQTARKRDSQDVCFAPDGDYASFIEQKTGVLCPAGNFISPEGRVIGSHRGHIRYTIGQRRGLGLSLPSPLYVREKNAEKNEVYLCPEEGLYSDSLKAGNLVWSAFDEPPESFFAEAKVRYSQTEQPCAVTVKDGIAAVKFSSPLRAISRGQAVVFYDGETVLGGGTIL